MVCVNGKTIRTRCWWFMGDLDLRSKVNLAAGTHATMGHNRPKLVNREGAGAGGLEASRELEVSDRSSKGGCDSFSISFHFVLLHFISFYFISI